MELAIYLLFLLPWLDRSPVQVQFVYRGWMFKSALTIFTVSFVLLGYLGTKNPQAVDLVLFSNLQWAQICYFLYFAFFLLMPIYTKLDPVKPVPDRVTFK